MLSELLAKLRQRVRRAATSSPALTPLFARLRGIHRRTLQVKGRPISFVSGPREFTPPTGVDRDGRYEGPFVDRLADSIAAGAAAAREGVFFDVGGQVGFDTLLAHTFGARQLHIFEPDPLAQFFIERNLADVPHVLVRRLVGDHDDQHTLSLDRYCDERRLAPTHIKMDIEGHEVFCLPGMLGVLERHRPELYVEFHERIIRDELGLPDADARVAGFFTTLCDLGYRLEYNGHHHAMVTGGTGRYDDTWLPEPPGHVNFAVVATPRR